MIKGWCVRVSVFDELVVSISERELCGRNLSKADIDLIRDCAWHLLSFVGPKHKYGMQDCTCIGSCRGAEGLGAGWNCVVDNGSVDD